MSDIYVEIGLKLKKARENCELTQTQVAKYLNVKREQISYYETGSREINLSTLNKLSNLYGYSAEYFLGKKIVEKESIELAFRANDLDDNALHLLARSHNFLMNLNWLENLKIVEKSNV